MLSPSGYLTRPAWLPPSLPASLSTAARCGLVLVVHRLLFLMPTASAVYGDDDDCRGHSTRTEMEMCFGGGGDDEEAAPFLLGVMDTVACGDDDEAGAAPPARGRSCAAATTRSPAATAR